MNKKKKKNVEETKIDVKFIQQSGEELTGNNLAFGQREGLPSYVTFKNKLFQWVELFTIIRSVLELAYMLEQQPSQQSSKVLLWFDES